MIHDQTTQWYAFYQFVINFDSNIHIFLRIYCVHRENSYSQRITIQFVGLIDFTHGTARYIEWATCAYQIDSMENACFHNDYNVSNQFCATTVHCKANVFHFINVQALGHEEEKHFVTDRMVRDICVVFFLIHGRIDLINIHIHIDHNEWQRVYKYWSVKCMHVWMIFALNCERVCRARIYNTKQ